MKAVSKLLINVLNVAMAFSLASMAILVFGNVVLRYAFNSGITWSEEMSRYLFVYMVFLGSIGALKDNQHLGVDIIVKKLPHTLKRVVYIISSLFILYVLYLVLDGSWKMTLLNMNSSAPATGLPLSFIYGIGVFMSVCMALIIIVNIIHVIRDPHAIELLSQSKDSEEIAPATHPHHLNNIPPVGGGK
ncbi:TRAP transporter small permease [Ammoniphilus sp. YIM 78166]|uniref:TRAP transporter small permease n=1 Tax=Ammoniphilus sp. YIM 78166 TaxID=1644106 RepID=UPI0035125E50